MLGPGSVITTAVCIPHMHPTSQFLQFLPLSLPLALFLPLSLHCYCKLCPPLPCHIVPACLLPAPVLSLSLCLSMQIALDYDDISQLTAEGFELTCCLLDTDGALEDQEQMWQSFLMTYSENVPKVQHSNIAPHPPSLSSLVTIGVI